MFRRGVQGRITQAVIFARSSRNIRLGKPEPNGAAGGIKVPATPIRIRSKQSGAFNVEIPVHQGDRQLRRE